MTVSILVVDDESDVAELFRQRFRREVRQGTYAMHFANSGEEATGQAGGPKDAMRPKLHAYSSSDFTQPLLAGAGDLMLITAGWLAHLLRWRPVRGILERRLPPPDTHDTKQQGL